VRISAWLDTTVLPARKTKGLLPTVLMPWCAHKAVPAAAAVHCRTLNAALVQTT